MTNIPLPRLEIASNACCNTYNSNRGGKTQPPRRFSRGVLANRSEYIFDINTRKVGESTHICVECGIGFSGWYTNANKFCSYYCYHKNRWNPETRKFVKIDGVWYKGKCGDCGIPVKNQYAKRCHPCRVKSTIGRPRPYQQGAGHHNWKGGITSQNLIFRNSMEYKAWRKSVFVRDNFTCVFCGQVGGQLQADHIKPFATYPDLRLVLENGRTLCKPCHLKTPTWGRKAVHVS